MPDLPSHTYYRACQGAWRTPLDLRVHDASALVAAGMARLDRWSLRGMAAWPRWLGSFTMETTVDHDPRGVVAHTTVVRWLGLPLMRSAETITLDPDGRAFTLAGTQRVGLAPGRSISGRGSVGADALTAHYELTWLGVTLRQSTLRDGDLVTVTQEGPGFTGVQRLTRR